MLALARTRLADAQLAKASLEGRFASAYSATHAAALAALRWHGYRSRIGSRCFSASRTRCVGRRTAGGCWMRPTGNGTWPSTKACERYNAWLKERSAQTAFSAELREWLDRMAERIATSHASEPADFETG